MQEFGLKVKKKQPFCGILPCATEVFFFFLLYERIESDHSWQARTFILEYHGYYKGSLVPEVAGTQEDV